jgi:hypothetical protein
MIVLFGDRAVDYSLSVNFVAVNKNRMDSMFFPMALIIIMFSSPGILFFCEGCKCP